MLKRLAKMAESHTGFVLLMCALAFCACVARPHTPVAIDVASPMPTIFLPPVVWVMPTPTASPTLWPTSIGVASPSPQPEPTSTMDMEQSTPTPANTPTATLTPVPVLQLPRTQVGTPVPRPAAAISPQSAHQVVELARWGKGTVSQVVYSGDGKLLAVASSLGIYLYDARTLKEVGFIQTESAVTRIAMSHDGKIIAGVVDGPDYQCEGNVSVRLWSLRNGAWQSMWQKSVRNARALTFLAGSKSLMVDEMDGIALWQVSDGAIARKLSHSGYSSVAFLPVSMALAFGKQGSMELLGIDGNVLDRVELPEPGNWDSISGVTSNGLTVAGITYESGQLFIWHMHDGDLIAIPDLRHESVALSSDGAMIAAGYEAGLIRLYRARDGKLLRTLKGHDISSVSVAFSPDGLTLVSASNDGVVRLWRTSDGALLQSLPGHALPSPSGILSFDRSILASASGRTIQLRGLKDGGLWRIWEVPTHGNPRTNFEGPVGAVSALAFSPDGSILASGMDDGLIYFWRVADAALLQTLNNECPLWNITFSPDGQILVTRGYWLSCSTVRMWRISDGAVLHSGYGEEFALSHDGKLLAIMLESTWQNPNDVIEMRRSSDGKLMTTLDLSYGYVNSLIFAPDDQILAVTTHSGVVQLWRASGEFLWQDLTDYRHEVNVAFSPDGQTLASISQDGTSRLRRVADGKLLCNLDEEAGRLSAVVFSPDGQIVASAAGDHAIRLWRVSDGASRHVLYGHTKWVSELVFLSSRLLLSSSGDDTVRLWGIMP